MESNSNAKEDQELRIDTDLSSNTKETTHILVNVNVTKETTNTSDQNINGNTNLAVATPPSSPDRASEELIHVTEIEKFETEETSSNPKTRIIQCNKLAGPHIILFSILCMPAALISSLCVSFYFGAWTWYNLYIYFSEERTMWHKVFICPVLILTFPFTVAFSSLGIALFATFVQLSWFYISWRTEFMDFEKGFYGYLCNIIGLSQCCPYDIVVLNDESELEPMRTSV